MIRNKADYKKYTSIELRSTNSILQKVKSFLCTTTDSYIKILRKFEYHYNSYGIMHELLSFFYYLRWNHLSVKLGIYIPKNVCEEGLTLYHYGSIVINPDCRIGKNCCIQNNVNIGVNIDDKGAPIIGDNVYIGPGAVIFGDIYIADNCYIGANAVVTKSVNEPYSVVVGVPAKFIRKEKKNWLEKQNNSR